MMDTTDSIQPGDAIPIVEETLSVSKRKVQTGVVRVDKEVEAHDYIVTESLRSEQAVVERVPKGIEVDGNQPPQVRIENGVTIIPVLEEVLVVEKRLVLKEELHIRQEVSEVISSQPVTLKKERLVLNRMQNTDGEEL
jgi:uncharacterized protein (TIGR02271 family)